MRVLVDGHNAMFALQMLRDSHEDARRELLQLVRTRARGAERIVVYFDGRSGPRHLNQFTREQGVDVVYCKDTEADAEILHAVEHHAQPRELLVVSNDRELCGRCRNREARTQSVSEFFGARPDPPPPPPPSSRRRSPRSLLQALDDTPDDRPPAIEGEFTPADFDLPEEIDLDDPTF